MAARILGLFTFLLQICSGVNGHYALLSTNSSGSNSDVMCTAIVSDSHISPLEPVWYTLTSNVSTTNRLDAVLIRREVFDNKSCLEDRPPVVILVNGENDKFTYSCDNASKSILLIPSSNGQHLMELVADNSTVLVRPFLPEIRWQDMLPSLLVLWIIAMVTIVTGSIIAQPSITFLKYGLLLRKGEIPKEAPKKTKETWKDHLSTFLSFLLTVMIIVGFLLILYYKWTVGLYIAIVMFTLSSSQSMFAILSPFVALVPVMETWRIPEYKWISKVPILKYRPDPRFFLLECVCIAMAVWWAVERNSTYGWILLTLLAYMLIVNLMRSLLQDLSKQPRLWVFTVILVIFFFYDMFAVYITRYFSEDGKSFMEKIAGFESMVEKTCEKIPLLFTVPKFLGNDLYKYCNDLVPDCMRNYQALGFGDVVIPGFLVCFCLYLDLTYHAKRLWKVYFTVVVVGYGLGMVVTFVVMFVTESAQPALVFLVPGTLIPTHVCALLHREWKVVFFGPPKSGNQANDIEQQPLYIQENEDSESEEELTLMDREKQLESNLDTENVNNLETAESEEMVNHKVHDSLPISEYSEEVQLLEEVQPEEVDTNIEGPSEPPLDQNEEK